jgi:integrase
MPEGIKPIKESPGFYRRPGSKTVYFRVGKGERRRWHTAANLPTAKTQRQHLQTDFDRGLSSLDGQARFADYARQLMATYGGRTRKGFLDETREGYLEALERYAFVFFEKTKIGSITPLLVTEFYNWVANRGATCRSCRDHDAKRPQCKNCRGKGRKGELSQNTVRLAAAPFKIVMQVAFEQGVIPRNPCMGVRLPAPPKSEQEWLDLEDDEGDVKALSERQLQAVLELIRRRYSYWLLFVELLVELGLRIGEALELRWQDIEFDPMIGEGERARRYEGAVIWIRRRWYRGKVAGPKSRFGRRRLKLAPAKALALRAHYERELVAGRGKPEDLVFTTEIEHARVNQGNLARDMLHPVREELGIPWLTWHIFRHTSITRRFLAGWNAKQVQVFAGHHDPAFTVSRYVHLLSDELPDPEPLTEILTEPVRLGVAV